MGSQRYAEFLTPLLNWIQQTLDAHVGEKRPVAFFKFQRLPRYFSAELLDSASVVISDRPPRPPLRLGSFRIRQLRETTNGGNHLFGRICCKCASTDLVG
jgi:hypothetical protein